MDPSLPYRVIVSSFLAVFAQFCDTYGNIFGGFIPVTWEFSKEVKNKADGNRKTYLFRLKNPHNVPVRMFALDPQKKGITIDCDSNCSSNFYESLFAIMTT
jgi:hypothetical protein